MNEAGTLIEVPAGVKSIVDDKIYVKAAFLHQSITWPGVAGAEKTITKEKIGPSLVMYLVPQGLMLEAKGKQCLIPHTNVVNYVL